MIFILSVPASMIAFCPRFCAFCASACASISAGSPSQIMFAQVTVDGNISTYTQYEPKDANNQQSWTPFAQFTLLSDSSVTVNLEYGKVAGSASIQVKESRISYWRVF